MVGRLVKAAGPGIHPPGDTVEGHNYHNAIGWAGRTIGQVGSSTRMELTALLAFLQTNKAVHVEMDNEAVVQRAQSHIELHRQHTHPKPPHKKPLSLLKDGDMWQQLWIGIRTRGALSARVSKVGGHADEAVVSKGLATAWAKQGHDNADAMAHKGISTGLEGRKEAARHVLERILRYSAFMESVRKYSDGES